MYLNLDNSRASLQNRVFIMFQVTVLPALIITQVEVMFHIKRALFFREQSSKMYSPFVFSSSVVLAELPYSIMCAVAFCKLLPLNTPIETALTRSRFAHLLYARVPDRVLPSWFPVLYHPDHRAFQCHSRSSTRIDHPLAVHLSTI